MTGCSGWVLLPFAACLWFGFLAGGLFAVKRMHDQTRDDEALRRYQTARRAMRGWGDQ